jgi:hypothetical protein
MPFSVSLDQGNRPGYAAAFFAPVPPRVNVSPPAPRFLPVARNGGF